MTSCREYVGRRNSHGYVRVPFGEHRVDSQGRRRGRKMVMLHRWVVEQVEGPLAPDERVLHRCDNPPCFLYEHLQRGTQADNVHDAEIKGRGRRVHGQDSPNAKLTDAQVVEIRIALGSEAERPVARRFGVSRALVRKIKIGAHRPNATCPTVDQHRKAAR